MINKFLHGISHFFGWNSGKVATWTEENFICVGFKCSGCGEIEESTIDRIESYKVLNDGSNMVPTDE